MNKWNPKHEDYVKNIKMQIDVRTTEVNKHHFRKLKKSFGVTWESWMFKAAGALLRERADINTSILYNSAVECFRTKSGKHVLKKRKGCEYTSVYIYWVSKASKDRLNIYHSVGEPLTYEEREDIIQWKMSERSFHKDILNKFDLGYEHIMPEVE